MSFDSNEQDGEPELARLSVFQCRFLRLQFLVCHRQLRWSANPVTSIVELNCFVGGDVVCLDSL
jgi:hypothetical protein